MPGHDIIVLGASIGGVEAMHALLPGLQADIPAAMFVVWHLSADSPGVLPNLLRTVSPPPIANARDGDAIVPGRISVAPPDYHLLIERGRVRLTRGPKENRFRPAVDPLFRSAAAAYGRRVVGVILSGALDDGTAGLWTIKDCGGVTIVQDPLDALHLFGQLSQFTCPECHGTLMQITDSTMIRFRCHTGHAYSLNTLFAELVAGIEDSLWSSIRAIEERVLLPQHVAAHIRVASNTARAEQFAAQAREAEQQAQLVRLAVLRRTSTAVTAVPSAAGST